MAQAKIKNIIFDLGNTLIYYDFYYFYNGVAQLERRLNVNKFVKHITEQKLDRDLFTGRINHKQFFKILKKKFNLKIGFKDFIYLYSDIFWENAQMLKLLEKLLEEKNYKVFLLSNTDSAHYNFIANNYPIIKLIKNRILSYKIKMVKPEKKIFKYVMNKYGLKPKETILIDDVKENILSASKCGIKTIHYKSHKKFQRELNKLLK
ncbi:MAG TPA: HAD-IA family hydrolase [Ignavibacteria bacterium]|nr:HAD-IA family hydrolase [Ignavibacteria bacterium]